MSESGNADSEITISPYRGNDGRLGLDLLG